MFVMAAISPFSTQHPRMAQGTGALHQRQKSGTAADSLVVVTLCSGSNKKKHNKRNPFKKKDALATAYGDPSHPKKSIREFLLPLRKLLKFCSLPSLHDFSVCNKSGEFCEAICTQLYR